MKIIPGFEHYKIDKSGNIYRNGKKRTADIAPSGYIRITLHKEGIQFSFKVHRLVALTYLPNPLDKPQVNHIDGNKLNNNVTNLEWVTDSENKKHAWSNGMYTGRGIKNSRAILTDDLVKEIREFAINRPIRDVATQYNLTHFHAYKIVTRRLWKHV